MPYFLEMDDVLESHELQIKMYGGTEGIRDIGLLESALAQPKAEFGGQYLHVDLFEMAAAYLFHIVSNHPFIDGNKRVGLESAPLFLEVNGASLNVTDEELVEITIQTATGNSSKKEIAAYFRSHAA
jgi:death on curing protein